MEGQQFLIFPNQADADRYNADLYKFERHPTSTGKGLFGEVDHPTSGEVALIIPPRWTTKLPQRDKDKLIDSLSQDWYLDDPHLDDFDAPKYQTIGAPISDDPKDSAIRREAELIRFNEIDFLKEKLSVVVRVKHFLKADDSPVLEKNFNRTLRVNNETRLPNPQGQGDVGEFDLYWSYYEAGQRFLDLVPGGIQVSDSLGRFNEQQTT